VRAFASVWERILLRVVLIFGRVQGVPVHAMDPTHSNVLVSSPQRLLKQRQTNLLLAFRLFPRLGRQRIVRGGWPITNVSRKRNWKVSRFAAIKNTEHVADKRPDLIRLAFFLGVDVLQMRNHVHDFFQSLRHFLFFFLEFENEFAHVVETALAFGAVCCRLQNSTGLVVADDNMTSRSAAGDLRVWRRRGVSRIKTQEKDGGESFYIKAQLTILNRSQRRKTSFPIVLQHDDQRWSERFSGVRVVSNPIRQSQNPSLTLGATRTGRAA
jgi:hypothetical protein